MEIDKSFRIVFNNIVIRNKIFYFVNEISKKFNGKKYNQCNIKWCVLNKQFNLLVYKLSREVTKKNAFSDDYFNYFLKYNTDPQLLKQMFKIFPNLIPTTERLSSILIEKCSLGNSILSIPVYHLYGSKIEETRKYIYKNKYYIYEYLMKELNIKPTKQTLNNLCIGGENIDIIKSMFDQGYFSISEDCDIGLLYCSLKAKDLSFYKLVLENNPTLKNEFQNMDNHILNQLLASTCNVEFYKYSFDEILNDETKVSTPFPKHKEPKLYYLNSTAIQFGNIEIIEYLCNSVHLFPEVSFSNLHNVILSTIANKKMDKQIDNGINSLSLLKFFLQHPKFDFQNHHLQSAFVKFIINGKLDCLVYLKQLDGNIEINSLCLKNALENNQFGIFNWLITYNDGITPKINCSVDHFFTILQSLSNSIGIKLYKSILDPILLNPNSQITENDILRAILASLYLSRRERYDYLCSFIKNDNLKPDFRGIQY